MAHIFLQDHQHHKDSPAVSTSIFQLLAAEYCFGGNLILGWGGGGEQSLRVTVKNCMNYQNWCNVNELNQFNINWVLENPHV